MKLNLIILHFLTFTSLYLTSCDKCDGTDTKVGETTIADSSKNLILQYVGKKVIFKDSIGRELVIRDTSGLVKLKDTLITGVTCQNNWPHRSLFNFLEAESWEIGLKCDAFTIHQRIHTINQSFEDTSLLYDIFKLNILSKKDSLGLFFDFDISKRGVATRPDFRSVKDFIIPDTMLNNKKFFNLIHIPNQRKQIFIESYFDKTKGLIAFKLSDKNLWIFDRIE
jgi:hypothetical protein